MDIGCYTGANLIYYAQQGHSVAGVEIAEPYYRECLRRMSEAGVEAPVYHAPFESWVPDGEYDHVLCTELLGHVVDPAGFVRKCHGVLKPQGTAFFTAPVVPPGAHTTWARIVDSPDLVGWAEAAGFEVTAFTADKQHICIGRKGGN